MPLVYSLQGVSATENGTAAKLLFDKHLLVDTYVVLTLALAFVWNMLLFRDTYVALEAAFGLLHYGAAGVALTYLFRKS